jgi:hypothetical protein
MLTLVDGIVYSYPNWRGTESGLAQGVLGVKRPGQKIPDVNSTITQSRQDRNVDEARSTRYKAL